MSMRERCAAGLTRPLQALLRRSLAACLVRAAWPAMSTMAASLPALPADAVPHLGRPISADDAAAAGATIFPDGRGLPAGSGTAVIGKAVFAQHCARCHGDGGRGGSAPELVGGTVPLNGKRPDKTIGLYWPAAPTLFDFNWRAMPMDKPGSLTADEAYAVTAYLLFADGVIGETARMDAKALSAVRMPNRNGFRWIDAKQPAPTQ
jgi:mono/diheme cytochrome c family protein